MDTSRPRYLHMFLVFVKIGLFTIGGGPAMIPLIRDEFVEKQKWIRDEDITDVLALSQSLPGVIAVNASTFLGYRLGGLKGSLVATIGVVLPSFVIIFVIVTAFTSSGFDQYPNILKFCYHSFIDRSNSETDSLFHQKQFWLVHSGLFTAWDLFFQSRHCHNRSAGLSAWLLRH